MHSADSLNSVEPIELESPSVESFGEVAVAGEILLLDLEFSRFATAVIHVVCVVNRISNVQSVLGII